MADISEYIDRMVSDTYAHLESGEARKDANILKFPVRASRQGSLGEQCDGQIEMCFEGPKASFDEKRLCLTLTLASQTIEIPVNWGPIKDLDLTSAEQNISVFLDESNDEDFFLEVLKSHLGLDLHGLELKREGGYWTLKLVEATDSLCTASLSAA